MSLPLIAAVLPGRTVSHAADAFQNALHPLAFFVLTLALMSIFPAGYGASRVSRLWRIARIVGGLVLLACVTELVQILVPGRTASVDDLLADVLGVAAGLLLFTAVTGSRVRALRAAACAFAIVLLCVALAPSATTLMAFAVRPHWPTLEEAGSALVLERVDATYGSSVSIERLRGRRWLSVRLGSGSWPGLEFIDVQPDWRDCGELLFDIELRGSQALRMTLRIDDAMHDTTHRDRYSRAHRLMPGRQVLRVPLYEVLRMGQKHPARLMDMASIARVMLFGSPDDAGRTFALASVRLGDCRRLAVDRSMASAPVMSDSAPGNERLHPADRAAR